jgi:hypothetical protein
MLVATDDATRNFVAGYFRMDVIKRALIVWKEIVEGCFGQRIGLVLESSVKNNNKFQKSKPVGFSMHKRR